MIPPRVSYALTLLASMALYSPTVLAQSSQPASNTAAAIATPQTGMPVFSRDGIKIGVVESVDTAADRGTRIVYVTTGSFLGFGAKLVAVPESKFNLIGESVRIDITADDINTLPHQGP
jgi:hypothetical protein